MNMVLGTAQFGLDYGLTNQAGCVAPPTVAAILRAAQAAGFSALDTAAAYGSAEATLGTLPEALDFHLCAKIGASAPAEDPVPALAAELDQSLHRLGRTSAEIVLLHRAHWLSGPDGNKVRTWLETERAGGHIGAYGVSVYDPEEVTPLLADGGIHWVQLPLSVLSPRWWTDGHLARLRDAGVRVQARSLLLQGLAVSDPATLPPALAGAAAPLGRLRAAAAANNTTPLALALSFAVAAPVDALVLGVTSVAEVNEAAAALAAPVSLDWTPFACADPVAADPRLWPPNLKIT